jgi:hypothetical protein
MPVHQVSERIELARDAKRAGRELSIIQGYVLTNQQLGKQEVLAGLNAIYAALQAAANLGELINAEYEAAPQSANPPRHRLKEKTK